MSSTGFTVDVDDLEQAVIKLQGLAAFLGEQLDAYDEKVAALLSTAWSGAAADAFRDAQSQWVAAAREFVAGVKDAGEELEYRRAAFLRAQAASIRMHRL